LGKARGFPQPYNVIRWPPLSDDRGTKRSMAVAIVMLCRRRKEVES
jgi:hypothetical protein